MMDEPRERLSETHKIPSDERDYHLALTEASLRRIEKAVCDLAATDAALVPRVDQLERTVFGYKVGSHTAKGLEEEFREALPALRKVNSLIKSVNVLIIGLVPTLGTLILYLLTNVGVLGP